MRKFYNQLPVSMQLEIAERLQVEFPGKTVEQCQLILAEVNMLYVYNDVLESFTSVEPGKKKALKIGLKNR